MSFYVDDGSFCITVRHSARVRRSPKSSTPSNQGGTRKCDGSGGGVVFQNTLNARSRFNSKERKSTIVSADYLHNMINCVWPCTLSISISVTLLGLYFGTRVPSPRSLHRLASNQYFEGWDMSSCLCWHSVQNIEIPERA